jgi:hypothetical protein
MTLGRSRATAWVGRDDIFYKIVENFGEKQNQKPTNGGIEP